MTKTKKEKTLFENIEIKDRLETKLYLSTSHDLLLPVLDSLLANGYICTRILFFNDYKNYVLHLKSIYVVDSGY